MIKLDFLTNVAHCKHWLNKQSPRLFFPNQNVLHQKALYLKAPRHIHHMLIAFRKPIDVRTHLGGKPKKNEAMTMTHEECCVVDPAILPPDAVLHGTTDAIVQRLHLVVAVVRFVREI